MRGPSLDFRITFWRIKSILLWVYGHYKLFIFFQCGDRLYTSESDVYRRRILTYKVDPRTERVNVETSVSTLISSRRASSRYMRIDELLVEYTLFNNNTPHSEQRWTVLIRQLLHTFQWQHATQWPTLNCFNQTTVHAHSFKQSICTRHEWVNTVDLVLFSSLNFREFLILGLFTNFTIREFSFFFRSAIIIIIFAGFLNSRIFLPR